MRQALSKLTSAVLILFLQSLFKSTMGFSFMSQRSINRLVVGLRPQKNIKNGCLPIGQLSSFNTIGSRRQMSSVSSDSEIVADSSTDIKQQVKPMFRIFYNDVYEVKLPKGHRFPMDKYQQVRKNIQQIIGNLPKEERERVECDFNVSKLASEEELTTTHSPEYVRKVTTGDLTERELRNVGFPWSEANVKRSFSSVGGTVAAAEFVCEKEEGREDGQPPAWGAHVAGGTHHAFYDRGEGFCVFSDIAVAANVVLQRFPSSIQKILILDLDVHQGNGNAVLFQDRPEVSTFSMHCVANYFSEKQHSDVDVELPPNCTDQTYLMTLGHWLKRIENEGGPFDLVFFQAGVDILEDDRLGRMSLSQEGMEKRNKLVFEFASRLDLPLVITMGGGYPRTDDWKPILQAHSNVYLQARQHLANLAVKGKGPN